MPCREHDRHDGQLDRGTEGRQAAAGSVRQAGEADACPGGTHGALVPAVRSMGHRLRVLCSWLASLDLLSGRNGTDELVSLFICSRIGSVDLGRHFFNDRAFRRSSLGGGGSLDSYKRNAIYGGLGSDALVHRFARVRPSPAPRAPKTNALIRADSRRSMIRQGN